MGTALFERTSKGVKLTIAGEVILNDINSLLDSWYSAKEHLKELKEYMEKSKYPSVSYELADELQKRTGQEIRVTVPGHTQRGGTPCAYDRVFASRLGAEAGALIMKGEYGFMVGYKNREIVKVPLDEVAGKLKYVSPDATIIKEAKLLGISFGD